MQFVSYFCKNIYNFLKCYVMATIHNAATNPVRFGKPELTIFVKSHPTRGLYCKI